MEMDALVPSSSHSTPLFAPCSGNKDPMRRKEMLDEAMDSPPVHCAREMGFADVVIQQIQWQKIILDDCWYATTESLIDALTSNGVEEYLTMLASRRTDSAANSSADANIIVLDDAPGPSRTHTSPISSASQTRSSSPYRRKSRYVRDRGSTSLHKFSPATRSNNAQIASKGTARVSLFKQEPSDKTADPQSSTPVDKVRHSPLKHVSRPHLQAMVRPQPRPPFHPESPHQSRPLLMPIVSPPTRPRVPHMQPVFQSPAPQFRQPKVRPQGRRKLQSSVPHSTLAHPQLKIKFQAPQNLQSTIPPSPCTHLQPTFRPPTSSSPSQPSFRPPPRPPLQAITISEKWSPENPNNATTSTSPPSQLTFRPPPRPPLQAMTIPGRRSPKHSNVTTSHTATEATEEPSSKSLQKRLDELERERICKICLDAQSNILFQPCGHISTCVECSRLVKTCPVCKARIRRSVRAYHA